MNRDEERDAAEPRARMKLPLDLAVQYFSQCSGFNEGFEDGVETILLIKRVCTLVGYL